MIDPAYIKKKPKTWGALLIWKSVKGPKTIIFKTHSWRLSLSLLLDTQSRGPESPTYSALPRVVPGLAYGDFSNYALFAGPIAVNLESKIFNAGVPTVAHGDWQCLGSAGAEVRSVAQHSGLRMWCRCSCGLGHNYDSNRIPGPGTPYAEE